MFIVRGGVYGGHPKVIPEAISTYWGAILFHFIPFHFTLLY